MGAFCLHHTAGCGLGHVGCLGRFSDLKAMILFRLVQFDSFDLGRGRDGCFQHAPGLMFPSNNTTFFCFTFFFDFLPFSSYIRGCCPSLFVNPYLFQCNDKFSFFKNRDGYIRPVSYTDVVLFITG